MISLMDSHPLPCWFLIHPSETQLTNLCYLLMNGNIITRILSLKSKDIKWIILFMMHVYSWNPNKEIYNNPIDELYNNYC